MSAPCISVLLFAIFVFYPLSCSSQTGLLPVVINTWPFTNATSAAWNTLVNKKGSIYDALVDGCSVCEIERCDGSVGPGGSPDENGETTLDAMVMNGQTFDVGAVGCLRRIPTAIAVARAVMDYTEQTLLVGELATQFAVEMGFKETNLSSDSSVTMWKDWKAKNCQPNYRTNVTPDPTKNCGPYKPKSVLESLQQTEYRGNKNIDRRNHDTIGMVVIDEHGNITAGTTTNGLNHKIPGRVGDSPIMGAGAYAMNGVGGAVATGDGDVMMRFLPSYMAVNSMGMGNDPTTATQSVMARITNYYLNFVGAVVAVTHHGEYGAACYGFPVFHYSVINPVLKTVTLKSVECLVN
ncbi:N(4)-(Beta-N-acetylglucosaminyl)-L-asparaginase-like isoform X2 [Mytilus californianus]|uniref:N(4)-(Beta-N-acetylglucosaminyl)-L-asparaginase- like isoform X2 n=1 Tax=Mytilus californianus TaxID=6549 RepID=UPI0022478EEC|nr:N(4)-(Beta-N-acetylglucosaminyl)-L-asparaginase-like isoform X2 [Mytilus californianus]